MWKAITNIFKDNKGYKNEFTERMKSLSDEVLEDIGKYYFDDKLEFSGYFEDYYDKKDKSSGDARINFQPWITLWADEDPSGRKYSIRIDWSNKSLKHQDPDIQINEVIYKEKTYFVYIMVLDEGNFIKTNQTKFNKIVNFITSDKEVFTKSKKVDKPNNFATLVINKKHLRPHIRVGDIKEGNFEDSFVRDIKTLINQVRLNQKFGHIVDYMSDNLEPLTTKKSIISEYINDDYSNYLFISENYNQDPFNYSGFSIETSISTINIFDADRSEKYCLLSIDKYTNSNLKAYNEHLKNKNLFNNTSLSDKDYDFLYELNIKLNEFFKWLEQKNIETDNSRKKLLKKFDKDNNGTIDIIENKNDFNSVLKFNQKQIIEKEKELNGKYIQSFIKVDNYLKQKQQNLQLIFDTIKGVEKEKELDKLSKILQNDIDSYNLLIINAFFMVDALLGDDQLTFFEIYERFDKLNIFNSNYENEMLDKLSSIDKNLSKLNSNIMQLMIDIQEMSTKITSSIKELSFITSESTKSLSNRLGEVKSSIDTNNLLTLINTYQNYKINKNIKSLN